LVAVFAIELLIRVAGGRPFHPPEPLGVSALFVPDSLLGYTTRPGIVELPGAPGEWVSIRHNEEGQRAVEPADNYLDESERREIWILGGSIEYGLGLDDRETLPWLVYDRIRDLGVGEARVTNQAVVGYSASQVYLQIERAIGWGERPSVLVLPTRYGATMETRGGRYELSNVFGESEYRYPVVTSVNPIETSYKSSGYQPIGLASRLAVVNAVDSWFRSDRSRGADAAILDGTIALVRQHGIGIILLNSAGISTRTIREAANDAEQFVDLRIGDEDSTSQIASRIAEAIVQVFVVDR
jgi:hypothetical protein